MPILRSCKSLIADRVLVIRLNSLQMEGNLNPFNQPHVPLMLHAYPSIEVTHRDNQLIVMLSIQDNTCSINEKVMNIVLPMFGA